jgi:hypothetical protein
MRNSRASRHEPLNKGISLEQARDLLERAAQEDYPVKDLLPDADANRGVMMTDAQAMTDDMLKITRDKSIPLREIIQYAVHEDWHQTQMARLWGVSDAALCQALKRIGLARGRRGPRSTVPSQRELIERMGAAGLNGSDIARVLGVSRQRVSVIRQENRSG